MNAGPSYPSWLLLIVALVVVGALLVGIVTLLVNPRTRATIAKVLAILAGIAAIPVVVVFLLYWSFEARQDLSRSATIEPAPPRSVVIAPMHAPHAMHAQSPMHAPPAVTPSPGPSVQFHEYPTIQAAPAETPWSAVAKLNVIGIIVLGGLALVVMLVASPKTRPVAVVLLGLGGLLVLVTFLRFQAGSYEAQLAHQSRVSGAIAAPEPVSSPRPVEVIATPPEQPTAEQPDAADTATAEATEPPTATTNGSVIRAIGQAMACAMGQKPGKPASKAANKPPELKPAPVEAENPGPPVTPRPAWVSNPPRVGDGAYQTIRTIGPYTTRRECEARLPEALQSAVADYLEARYPGHGSPETVLLPFEELRGRAMGQTWEEWIPTSVGSTIPLTPSDRNIQDYPGWKLQLHVLVCFEGDVQDRIQQAWQRAIVNRRLCYAGAGLGGGLALLALLFGYLKVDLATKGAYRKRTGLATILLAAAVVMAAVALVA